MSIRRLPDDVASKIRSSATITSLNGVVCGLLKNSLDACATRINVYVDYSRGNCTVEDNGRGIAPSGFAEDGGLGKPNFTSKYPPNFGTHGRKGTFLAAVAALALISIASHHHRYNSHNAISIHHGRVLKRQRPAFAADRLETFDHGTRVAVHDLFGSMPVRVKHRATLFSDRTGIDKEWARLARDIVALLLAWPSGVSISLKETKAQVELRLKSGDAVDLISRTTRLLFQASLVDALDSQSWVPVSASLGHITIKGCISLDPVATRRSQFISLGIVPILDEFGSNVLYEEVNRVFKNSSFGVVEGGDADPRGPQTGEMRFKLRKGVDRWPMFYFRVSLNRSEVALDSDEGPTFRQRDLEDIISLLKELSYGFLKKHHFRPQKVGLLPKESPLSTEATARQPARAVGRTSGVSGADDARVSGSSSGDFPFVSDTNLNSWYRSKSSHNLETSEISQGTASSIHWEKAIPNRPVGWNSSKSQELSVSQDVREGVCDQKPRPEPSAWLQNVLKAWKNPVFETAELPLPQLNDQSAALTGQSGAGPALHRCHGGETSGINFEAGSMNLQGRVSRAALKNADIISQVDRKFILLKLPWQSVSTDKFTSALVILDQHAADERRRLEDLMAGYFTEDPWTGNLRAVTETLGKPILFEVSDQEGRLLQRYRDHFSAWGVVLSAQPRNQPRSEGKREDSCKVAVTALPPSILERCRAEPRLLVELSRKEIWRLHDEGIAPAQSQPRSAASTAEGLAANFHGCPRGILDLLHSRSCRSAIMFNDVLTREQCEGLVRGLARCALPFQCAHGRPSMVPLVDLGSDSRIGGSDGGDAKEALARWKRWMG